MEQHENHQHESHHHGGMKEISEIKTTVSYQDKTLRVHIEDIEGNAPELEVTHEELLHLIVVSEDLIEYHHLHPVKINEFTFEKEIMLTGHSYRAFIDINPRGKNYVIKPLLFNVGSPSLFHHSEVHPTLQIDKELTKEVRGKQVELIHDPFLAGQDIKLTFHIDNAVPEPYLGALGHVVIIDDKVQEFIHVHPISESETVFIANFEQRGTYKLWAEFKFDNEIIYFPYVIKVK